MPLPMLNWGPDCSRCGTRLETDYRRPPRLVAWLVRHVLPAASWRWCRRCRWRGVAFRASTPVEQTPAPASTGEALGVLGAPGAPR